MRNSVAASLAAAFVVAAPVTAETPALDSRSGAAVTLDRATLEHGPVAVSSWRFRAGDDPSWADPEYGDGAWQVVEPIFFRRGEPLPAGWQGIGWVRARIRVAPDLVGAAVALRLRDHGAAEVFFDGRRIDAAGTVGRDAANTVPRFQSVPTIFTFDRDGVHLLAVRFANHHVPALLRVRESSGVEVTLSWPELATKRLVASVRSRVGWRSLFGGLVAAFALLHLLLFLFERRLRANLDFAAMCLALTGIEVLSRYTIEQTDPRFLLVSDPIFNLLGLLVGITFLRFVYRISYVRAPRSLGLYVLICLPVAAWSVADQLGARPAVWLLMLTASAEAARVVGLAVVRRKPGARLLGVGVVSFATGIGISLLARFGVLVPGNVWTHERIPIYSFVILLVTMSTHLSRRFATVHRDLEARLTDVERLSTEKLEQERLRRAEEVERRVLETRYEEKVRELKEARELQLAMLPEAVPELPDLEVAAHMETATEVGGDYYDFELGADGTLTVAIGDATGHGMRAGTMVTATKGLFNVLAREPSLLEALSRATRAIRRMNLRKLAMALTLARYRDRNLCIAAAGMPPVLVYRASSGAVEQILLAGMPLGSMASFPYREVVVPLEPGDTVLLMSDGFAERHNRTGDPLGYDRTADVFATAADRPAPALIEHLCREAQAWAEGHPAEDDLTFVVLKVRQAPV